MNPSDLQNAAAAFSVSILVVTQINTLPAGRECNVCVCVDFTFLRIFHDRLRNVHILKMLKNQAVTVVLNAYMFSHPRVCSDSLL